MDQEKSRIEILQELIEIDPDDTFSWYALALEYKSIGDLEKAMQNFHEVIKRTPEDVAAYYQGSETLYRMAAYEEAIQWAKSGIQAAEKKGDLKAKRELTELLDSY